jgi:hypothetical protein
LLNSYLQRTQLLLNDAAATLYQLADLTLYINEGRAQLAIQAEILIANITTAITLGDQTFALSSLAPPTGYLNAINVRSISVASGGGGVRTMMEGRPWAWFNNYYYTGPNSAQQGPPSVWAQQTQGVSGTAYFWPLADGGYNMTVESSWTPIALVDDSTVEVIPYPWTDAVPFYAASRALQNAQRLDDSQKMFAIFQMYVKAARLGITPEILPDNFPTSKPLPGSIDPNLTMMPSAQPARAGEGTL